MIITARSATPRLANIHLTTRETVSLDRAVGAKRTTQHLWRRGRGPHFLPDPATRLAAGGRGFSQTQPQHSMRGGSWLWRWPCSSPLHLASPCARRGAVSSARLLHHRPTRDCPTRRSPSWPTGQPSPRPAGQLASQDLRGMKDKSPWIQVPLLAFQEHLQQVLGTTYPPQVWRQSADLTSPPAKSSPHLRWICVTPWRVMGSV